VLLNTRLLVQQKVQRALPNNLSQRPHLTVAFFISLPAKAYTLRAMYDAAKGQRRKQLKKDTLKKNVIPFKTLSQLFIPATLPTTYRWCDEISSDCSIATVF
jgi:hypothetical protein